MRARLRLPWRWAFFAAALVACLARRSLDPHPSGTPWRGPLALGRLAYAQEAAGAPSRVETKQGSLEWLVVVPHPDDATLIAAGVIARAVRAHEGVAVAFMTNGDFTCGRDGAEREDESVRALAQLGLDEQHVYFLGYPDGYLARLGHRPLPPVQRRIEGRCVRGSDTYAMHGHDQRDVHAIWFGHSAAYTSDNAVLDLSVLLESLRPRQIIVTHPMDVHPDHAATYVLLRRALARTGMTATVHRAIVHAGDCWPLGPEPGEPCPRTIIDPSAPFPALFGALHDYRFNERIPVPDDFLLPDVNDNPKLRAIRTFRSQLGPSPVETYLFTFGRSDEPFFVESVKPCDAGGGRTDCAGERGSPVALELTRTSPEQRVHQELPLVATFDWPKAAPAIEVLADERGAYQLVYDAGGHAAVLSRVDRGERRIIKTWLLPFDLWRSRDREPIELRFDPRPQDGDVVEVSLLLGGDLVGGAVDVHPKRSGESVRATLDAGATPLEVSIASTSRERKVSSPIAKDEGHRAVVSGAAPGHGRAE